jgi:hypothetical protein
VICIRQLKPKLSQIDGTNQTRQWWLCNAAVPMAGGDEDKPQKGGSSQQQQDDNVFSNPARASAPMPWGQRLRHTNITIW